MDGPQVNEEMMDEQYEDNEVVEGQDVQVSAGEPHDDPVEDQEGDSQERVDWKARAIEAETRAKEYQRWLEQQQGNAQAAQQKSEPSRLEQLQREVKELESSVPPVDPQNPETFWENQKAKDQLNQKRFELQEARIEQQQQSQLKMQAQTAVQSYKNRFRGDPRFKAIESQFDSAVTQLAPHLQTNPAMLDLLRKNAIFDYMEKNPDATTQTQQQQQSQKKPPQAPSGAYNQQAPAKQKGMKFKSEQDATVASFYRMTPEEFYNEPPSPHTEGNGIQIYDIPESPRRFGRG